MARKKWRIFLYRHKFGFSLKEWPDVTELGKGALGLNCGWRNPLNICRTSCCWCCQKLLCRLVYCGCSNWLNPTCCVLTSHFFSMLFLSTWLYLVSCIWWDKTYNLWNMSFQWYLDVKSKYFQTAVKTSNLICWFSVEIVVSAFQSRLLICWILIKGHSQVLMTE